MTADLRAQLQKTLGEAYSVERELPGGMSRVFVATETALGRRVVVKVLPPELGAGVSAERFRREIQLAAQLQHAHIVPVLTAGESQGLLFYTMPYVDGESLRARLAREGELPVGDAVRILRDVAAALAYAHRPGVVHRDIKPDNILLSEHDALVADFGVAKALERSGVGGDSAQTADTGPKTSLGIALGTPAYMAPEQAAGDPTVDHRADLYALGVVAYEMLTGRAPFTGRPTQALLAAHLTEAPEPLARRRPAVPPALAALVMRLLEKRPADRVQSAEELLRALDGADEAAPVATVGAGADVRPRSFRAWAAGGALVAVLVVVAGVALISRRSSRTADLDPNVVAIVPFRVSGADRSLEYLREGMLDLLAAKLTGEGGPRAVDPRTVMSAWRRAGGSEGEDVPQERALRLAEELGAGQLLLGGVVGTPSRVLLSASLLSVPGGTQKPSATAEGHPDSIPALVDQLATKLLALQAGEGERVASLSTHPLAAIQAYLAGQAAYRRGRYAEAVAQHERALRIDSTFALAALSYAMAAAWVSSPGSEPVYPRALQVAWRQRERLSARDRAVLTLLVNPRYPVAPRAREWVASAERALQLNPDRSDVWFLAGDVYLHWAPLSDIPTPHRRAQAAFEQALTLDSAFAGALEHLVDLAANGGDTARVRRLRALYLAQDSTADIADYVRWRTALALRDSAELVRLRARLSRMDLASVQRIIGTAQAEGIAIGDAELALRGLLARESPPNDRPVVAALASVFAANRGHIDEAARALREFERTGAAGEASAAAGAILGALYWDGDTATAASAVSRLTRVTDREPRSGPDVAHHFQSLCVLEQWRLTRGDTATVQRSIARLRALAARAEAPSLIGDPEICFAVLDLLRARAHGRLDLAAVTLADSLARTGPLALEGASLNLLVAHAYSSVGDPQGALAAVRRRQYHWNPFGTLYLSTLLREEGRLAALAADTAGAIRAYRHYLALRANPDAALRGETERVAREVARLERRAESKE